jgi:hypothetical protein
MVERVVTRNHKMHKAYQRIRQSLCARLAKIRSHPSMPLCVCCPRAKPYAGYFKPNSSENWHGSMQQLQLSGFPPDAGPLAATAAAGVVTVGAVPWVTNYNVPLHTDDMAAARAVARAVSTKGGGLPGVEVGNFLLLYQQACKGDRGRRMLHRMKGLERWVRQWPLYLSQDDVHSVPVMPALRCQICQYWGRKCYTYCTCITLVCHRACL